MSATKAGQIEKVATTGDRRHEAAQAEVLYGLRLASDLTDALRLLAGTVDQPSAGRHLYAVQAVEIRVRAVLARLGDLLDAPGDH